VSEVVPWEIVIPGSTAVLENPVPLTAAPADEEHAADLEGLMAFDIRATSQAAAEKALRKTAF
jgi:hypothetical protein